eukprot:scaffold114402_cov58-Attheya_sp.AAC.3
MGSIREHGVMFDLLRTEDVKWDAIVIDESQQLLEQGSSLFCSASNSDYRSLYSAVLNAFLDILAEVKKGMLPFPTISGTGMSMKLLTKESVSADAKRNTKSMEHIARWLIGRPRWTATFIEEFLVRKEYNQTYDGGTRGSFNKNTEKRVLQALEIYVCEMTKGNRSRSWTGGNRTPYASIENFMTIRPSGDNMQASPESHLECAIFKYDVGKKGAILSKDVKDLIKLGVTCLYLETIELDNTRYKAVISEPLVVAAGLEYFCLEAMAKSALNAQNDHGQGIAFEMCCLSPLCKLLLTLPTQFPKMGPFALSTKTS